MYNSQTTYRYNIPSMYGAYETIHNFTHFSITALLNNWSKVWGNPDIIFPKWWNSCVLIICTGSPKIQRKGFMKWVKPMNEWMNKHMNWRKFWTLNLRWCLKRGLYEPEIHGLCDEIPIKCRYLFSWKRGFSNSISLSLTHFSGRTMSNCLSHQLTGVD